MERYNPTKYLVEDEEDKSAKAIQDLIDMKSVDTPEERGRFGALIKALIFADTKKGDAFLTKINDFTSPLKEEDL